MISWHFSSFLSFMPILVLVKKVVCLFCAISGLIMSLPAPTTNKTSLKVDTEFFRWQFSNSFFF